MPSPFPSFLLCFFLDFIHEAKAALKIDISAFPVPTLNSLAARSAIFFSKNLLHDLQRGSPVTCSVHWLQVYDVTPFMDDHPGGDEVLLAATKKDATSDFEDVGHSNPARDLMDKYCIGKIDASTIPAKRVFVPPERTPDNPEKTSDFPTKTLQFLVPIMILGVAFAVRYYTRAE